MKKSTFVFVFLIGVNIVWVGVISTFFGTLALSSLTYGGSSTFMNWKIEPKSSTSLPLSYSNSPKIIRVTVKQLDEPWIEHPFKIALIDDFGRINVSQTVGPSYIVTCVFEKLPENLEGLHILVSNPEPYEVVVEIIIARIIGRVPEVASQLALHMGTLFSDIWRNCHGFFDCILSKQKKNVASACAQSDEWFYTLLSFYKRFCNIVYNAREPGVLSVAVFFFPFDTQIGLLASNGVIDPLE